MAKTPNADRVFQAISAILERRFQVNISYNLDERPPRGLFFPPGCCVSETKGASYEEVTN